MKKVRIDGLSLVEQVLIYILPEIFSELTITGVREKNHDIQIIDLDYLAFNQDSFICDGKTPLIGLTFLPPEKAKLDSQLVFFNCQSIYFLKKPFPIQELIELINIAPKGFGPVYRNPGVNLLWHLKNYLSSKENDLQDSALKKRIAAFYPDLLKKSKGNLTACLQKIPARVLNSFYDSLSHYRAHTGLEGHLAFLAEAANNFSPDDLESSEKILTTVRDFLKKTSDVRKSFLASKDDFEYLLEMQDVLNSTTVKMLTDFYELHNKLHQNLEELEIMLQYDEINPQDIAVHACTTAESLGELLDQRSELIETEGV